MSNSPRKFDRRNLAGGWQPVGGGKTGRPEKIRQTVYFGFKNTTLFVP